MIYAREWTVQKGALLSNIRPMLSINRGHLNPNDRFTIPSSLNRSSHDLCGRDPPSALRTTRHRCSSCSGTQWILWNGNHAWGWWTDEYAAALLFGPLFQRFPCERSCHGWVYECDHCLHWNRQRLPLQRQPLYYSHQAQLGCNRQQNSQNCVESPYIWNPLAWNYLCWAMLQPPQEPEALQYLHLGHVVCVSLLHIPKASKESSWAWLSQLGAPTECDENTISSLSQI